VLEGWLIVEDRGYWRQKKRVRVRTPPSLEELASSGGKLPQFTELPRGSQAVEKLTGGRYWSPF
jgi:hypothetical protein